VGLSAQQRIARNSEVLSEGEQRGLAIACFLAELNEIGSDHGIILDDPSRLSIILA
jgi:wobble nucleotide-excising tRNase